MHHPDPAGDSGGVRKMAHSAVFHRRGSNTGGGSGGSALSTPANPVVTNSHLPADDYQPSSLLIQCQPPAGSSSPGPHHIPPQSLNLHSQAQPAQLPPPSGAQIKKKSGFQITSVTPAQISVSTNNSIAEDTESYDDLDESHTEDLSSSEILDVSLSRANDVVGAERSSSEETLNNFHEADTPGAVSPNQPSHPHALNQAQQMVNGTVHHHHHHHHQQHPHHPNHAQGYPLPSVPGSPSPALTSGALPCVTQKMPSNKGVPQENVTQPAPASIIAQPVGVVAPGSKPGLHSSATGTTVSIMNPLTSNVSNVNTLSSANVPARERIGSSASSSGGGGGGFPPNVMSSGVGSTGGTGGGGNLMTTASVVMGQQHQNINSSITMTTTTSAAAAAAVAAVSASGGIGIPSGSQGRIGSSVLQPASAPITATALPSQVQPAPTPAAVPAASRFRVVKLDSSSEPFKKGRWTCAEFYDKDLPASASSSAASDASARQFASDSFAGACERDSTSGSSVSSTVSTLSHYNEVASGAETTGGAQHSQDFASPPHGFQGILPSSLSMGASQMHPQDIGHSQMKTTAPPSASSNIHHPAPMQSQQSSIGLSASTAQQQQLTYAQAVANQPTCSTQGLVGVKQQKMTFSSPIQQPSASPQAAQVQARPSEYTQSPPQGVPQGSASIPNSNPPGSAPAGATNGASQLIGALQQPQPLLHIKPQQPSSLQSSASNLPSHVGGAPGVGQQPQGHAGHLDCQQQQQTPQSLPTQIQNQGLGAQLPNTVHQSQVSATSVPAPNAHGDPQGQLPGQASSARMPSQGVPHSQQPCVTLARDPSSAQALAHAAQASALYASLPTFTTTQLQDAERLLLQHQSALLGLTKLSGGETVTGSSSAVQGQDAEGNAVATSALSAAAGIKTVDGEEDG